MTKDTQGLDSSSISLSDLSTGDNGPLCGAVESVDGGIRRSTNHINDDINAFGADCAEPSYFVQTLAVGYTIISLWILLWTFYVIFYLVLLYLAIYACARMYILSKISI